MNKILTKNPHFIQWKIATCISIFILLLGSNLYAQKLGLHVTQEELDIWRQRANSTAMTGTKE